MEQFKVKPETLSFFVTLEIISVDYLPFNPFVSCSPESVKRKKSQNNA